MKLLALAAASAVLLCAQSPVTKLPSDTVVATSDGKPITAGEIRNLLEVGDPTTINLAKTNPAEFLNAYFVMRYLADEAEKRHLAEQSPFKEEMAYINARFLAFQMVNQIRESYNVPEQAINDFYAKNKSRYEMAHIKVIVIGFCPAVPKDIGTSDEDIKKAAETAVAQSGCKNKHTEEQAHDMAMGIIGQLRGGHADFVKMVAKYSEDADSKATEGDFGLVTRDGAFKQEIKEAVFALNDTDVSDPIRSGNYFYIIKLKDKSLQPLGNVRESIIQELKQKHFTETMGEISKRLKPEILRPDFFTASKPQQ
jgi:parvulin-like peptidyl-prolyl isomerase